MTGIQGAIHNFYSQFIERVYLDALVPANALFPYITYNFVTCDYLTSVLMNFQIWDMSGSTFNIQAIADKIHNAIPSVTGTTIDIKSDSGYEYYNPSTGEWTAFALEDFVSIATEVRREYGVDMEWREAQGKTIGFLRLFRGSPFIQPRPATDEIGLIVYYGNIEIRSYVK